MCMCFVIINSGVCSFFCVVVFFTFEFVCLCLILRQHCFLFQI